MTTARRRVGPLTRVIAFCALDFGCGYGRLTRALAERLGSAVGVDISEQMVAGATQLNAGTTAEFVVNAGGDLAQFDDASFELIYSRIVLQHVPTRREILAYVAEFVRVLRPGGVAVFQIPSRIAPKHRIQPVARAYRALRAVGVPAKVLLEKLHLQPMRMTAVPVAAVTAEVERAGARVAEVDLDREPSGNESATYFVTR